MGSKGSVERREQALEIERIADLQGTDGTTTSHLPSNSNPLGIGNDEVRVPRLLGELDALVDLVTLGRGSEDVAVLGSTNKLGHLEGEVARSRKGTRP